MHCLQWPCPFTFLCPLLTSSVKEPLSIVPYPLSQYVKLIIPYRLFPKYHFYLFPVLFPHHFLLNIFKIIFLNIKIARSPVSSNWIFFLLFVFQVCYVRGFVINDTNLSLPPCKLLVMSHHLPDEIQILFPPSCLCNVFLLLMCYLSYLYMLML